MNNKKSNPVGIDVLIQKLQDKLYKEFGYLNDIETNDFDGYGRIYLNEKDGKIMPYHFISDKEYKLTTLDDSKDGIFFFIQEETEKRKNNFLTSEVGIVFLLNIKKIKSSILHRADEEVKLQIIDVLKTFRGYTWDEVIKGKEALRGINLNLIDMQPFHFIKFKGTIKYYINC